MTNDDKITDDWLQYELNREAAKELALSSSKIDKYEILHVQKYCPLIKSNDRAC